MLNKIKESRVEDDQSVNNKQPSESSLSFLFLYSGHEFPGVEKKGKAPPPS